MSTDALSVHVALIPISFSPISLCSQHWNTNKDFSVTKMCTDDAKIAASIQEVERSLHKSVPKAPEAATFEKLAAFILEIIDDRDVHEDYSEFPGPWLKYWFNQDDLETINTIRKYSAEQPSIKENPVLCAWDAALDQEEREDVHTKLSMVFNTRMDSDLCGALRTVIEIFGGAWLNAGARSGHDPLWLSHVMRRLEFNGLKYVGTTTTTCRDEGGGPDLVFSAHTVHVNWKYYVVLVTQKVQVDLVAAENKCILAKLGSRRRPDDVARPIAPTNPCVARDVIIGYWFVCCSPKELADRNL